MPQANNSDITANVVENDEGDLIVNRQYTQNQQFAAEDFIDVYNDSVENLKNIVDSIQQIEEEIQEMLAEKEDAMAVLHTLMKSEQQDDADLQPNSVSLDDINALMQLQQKKKQREQQLEQREQMRGQLTELRGAAQKVSDNPEEELKEIPEEVEEDEDGDEGIPLK